MGKIIDMKYHELGAFLVPDEISKDNPLSYRYVIVDPNVTNFFNNRGEIAKTKIARDAAIIVSMYSMRNLVNWMCKEPISISNLTDYVNIANRIKCKIEDNIFRLQHGGIC